MNFDIEIKGAEELKSKLASLEEKVATKVTRDAFNRAAKILINAMKMNAMILIGGNAGVAISKFFESRAIPKSWRRKHPFTSGVRVQLSPAGNILFVHTAKKSRYKGGRTYIPTAIEYGHIARDGSFVPAVPFARSAFESTKTEVAEAMVGGLKEAVEEAAQENQK